MSFDRSRSVSHSQSLKHLKYFLFLCARAECRRLWSDRAARGLYRRVASQHNLTLGLRGARAPLSSVRGGRPDSVPLEAYFTGTKPEEKREDISFPMYLDNRRLGGELAG